MPVTRNQRPVFCLQQKSHHDTESRLNRNRGVAQPGSAPALGAGSRRFKSSRPDQILFSQSTAGQPVITLYVLKGQNGKRYVGITNDLTIRLREHRSKRSKGSQVLGDFFVLHTEEFVDHKSARNREKFLKSGQGREWLNEFESLSEPAKGGYSP
jgi:putative endonuclease